MKKNSKRSSGLFWSNCGEVACAKHAPSKEQSEMLKGNGRWHREAWEEVSREVSQSAAIRGKGLRCDECAKPTTEVIGAGLEIPVAP